jgi:hypothetical protein
MLPALVDLGVMAKTSMWTDFGDANHVVLVQVQFGRE